MDATWLVQEVIWPNALAAVPMGLLVWGVCRWGGVRAATRHALWVSVLIVLLVPPVLPVGRWVSAGWEAARARAGGGTGGGTGAAVGPRDAGVRTDAEKDRVRAGSSGGPAGASGTRAGVIEGGAGAREPVDGGAAPGVFWRGGPGGGVVFGEPSGKAAEESARTTELVVGRDAARHAAVGTGVGGAPASGPERGTTAGPGLSAKAAGVGEGAIVGLEGAGASPSGGAARDRGAGEKAGLGATSGPAAERGTAAGERGAGVLGNVSEWVGVAWVALGHVVDGLREVPAVPAEVWGIGAGLALVGMAVRSLRLRRVIRASGPASESAREMVAGCALQLGLARAPEVVFVRERVSPMVWCGRRRVLVLPSRLWEELDELGRRAVVLHELAHLKRRDHWVCWVELAAGVVYWWHPLVWWARRRVREEADYCCDAWVTLVLPRQRRAYAQALLSTRAYLSGIGVGAPVNALGAASDTARSFARRLTMVMKGSGRPGMNAWGLLLAAGLAVVAAGTTPMWACPPEKKSGQAAAGAARQESERARLKAEKSRQKADEARMKAKMETDKAREKSKKKGSGGGGEGADETSFERYLKTRGGEQGASSGGRSEDEARVRAAEERLEALAARLTTMADGASIAGVAAGFDPEAADECDHECDEGCAEACEAAQAECEAAEAACEAAHSTAAGHELATAILAAQGRALDRDAVALNLQGQTLYRQALAQAAGVGGVLAAAGGDEVVVCEYELPEGKLDALYELLVRDDVPIRVRRTEGGIEVHASESAQRVIQSFLSVINPEGGGTAGVGALSLFGAAGRDFPTALAPGMGGAAGGSVRGQIEAAAATLRAHGENARVQAESMRARAEELRARGEALSAEGEAMRERAAELKGEQRRELRKQGAQLIAEAEAVIEESEELSQRGEELDEVAEAILERAEGLEEMISEKLSGEEWEQGMLPGGSAFGPVGGWPLEVILAPGAPVAAAAPSWLAPAAPPAPPAPAAEPVRPTRPAQPVPPTPPAPATRPAPAVEPAGATAPAPVSAPTPVPAGAAAPLGTTR